LTVAVLNIVTDYSLIANDFFVSHFKSTYTALGFYLAGLHLNHASQFVNPKHVNRVLRKHTDRFIVFTIVDVIVKTLYSRCWGGGRASSKANHKYEYKENEDEVLFHVNSP